MPSPFLNHKTSYELLFNQPPSYNHLCMLGCLCFTSTLHSYWSKFDPRASHCVFIGYPFDIKWFKLLNLDTFDTYISQVVHFYEHIYPFHSFSNHHYSFSIKPPYIVIPHIISDHVFMTHHYHPIHLPLFQYKYFQIPHWSHSHHQKII